MKTLRNLGILVLLSVIVAVGLSQWHPWERQATVEAEMLGIHATVSDGTGAPVSGGKWWLLREGYGVWRESDNPTGEVHWSISPIEGTYDVCFAAPEGYGWPESQTFAIPANLPIAPFEFVVSTVPMPTHTLTCPPLPPSLTPSAVPTVSKTAVPTASATMTATPVGLVIKTPTLDQSWPFALLQPSYADQLTIADKALQNMGWERAPLAELMARPVWLVNCNEHLGAPLTSEFLAFGDEEYVCQGFSTGIVIMKRGDWSKYGVVSWCGVW